MKAREPLLSEQLRDARNRLRNLGWSVEARMADEAADRLDALRICGKHGADLVPKGTAESGDCICCVRDQLADQLDALIEAVNLAEHHTRRLNPDEYAVSDIHMQSVWEAAYAARPTKGEQHDS